MQAIAKDGRGSFSLKAQNVSYYHINHLLSALKIGMLIRVKEDLWRQRVCEEPQHYWELNHFSRQGSGFGDLVICVLSRKLWWNNWLEDHPI